MHEHYCFPEAVNRAANVVISNGAGARSHRANRLLDLLHGFAQAIPDSWGTGVRRLLVHQERSIDYIVRVLSLDVKRNPEPQRYQVLSSVLLLALTIKQMSVEG